MLTIPRQFLKITEAIWLRIIIGAFFYLSLAFVRMFISIGAHDHPLLTVVCATLYDAMCIVIFQLLYGRHSVGRDINTLSFYGVALHLIYLVCYFTGVEFSEIHNSASKWLNYLIVLRCVFLTERELFAIVSPINITKKWLLKRQWFVNSYFNSLTVAVFALFAAPLFTMMYFINTDEMRASGIAVIFFAFYVAFENAKRHAATDASAGNVEPPASDAASIEAENHSITLARGAYFAVALVVAIGTSIIADNKERFFNVGYASGFADAKSGAKPKRETDFDKALWCNMVRNPGQPLPPGMTCDDHPPKN